jgi:putative lipoic acid-binding regulatory protein
VAAEDPRDDEQARARALAVLEATHQFPCDYSVTVIAFNREGVTDALWRAVGRTGDANGDQPAIGGESYESRTSSAGKYLSHRLAVRVAHAVEVLELYARLQSVDGIVTIF